MWRGFMLVVVIGGWIGLAALFLLGRIISQFWKKREDAAFALHEPLDPESQARRMDAALSQAEDGFCVCVSCGFENFKHHNFCMICGSALSITAPNKSTKRTQLPSAEEEKTLGSESSSDAKEMIKSTENASASRVRRAQHRRDWIRKIDYEGHISWVGNRANEDEMPVYLLRFRGAIKSESKASAMVESSGETTLEEIVIASESHQQVKIIDEEEVEAECPVQNVINSRVDELEKMAATVQMEFEKPNTADAAVFPVLVEHNDCPVDESAVLQLFDQNFPAKFADFIINTTKLTGQTESRHMRLHMNRETVLVDSMRLLALFEEKELRVAFRIDFENESGIDAGGLYREWFLMLIEYLLKLESGIFCCTDKSEQSFYLNPNAKQDIGDDYLLFFLATGRLLGRALLEGNSTGFHLALPLLKIILGQPVSFADLEFFDPEVYRNLRWILENDGVEAFNLDFSVSEQVGDKIVTIDFIPDGRNIPVTDVNKQEYVECQFKYLLFDRVAAQLQIFLTGFYQVVPSAVLMMFDPQEFDYVLCGADEIDVDDWERNTKFTRDLFNHPVTRAFWKIVRGMSNEYRRRLLQFATGSSRVPFAGFSALTSYDGRLCPFTLRGAPLENDGYVHSHACFNRLDIPRQLSKKQLERVLFAILDTEQHGFTTV